MKELKILLITVMSLMLAACFGMPEAVTPVKNFEVERYLGKWFEIARLDHSFERGLNNVSAEYTMRDDGGIAVVNRGYSVEEKQWKTAEGKAYFMNDKDEAYLKVSFFGPFYSSYVVFGLEQDNYGYAFISGPDTSYLWLLSRTPDVEQGVIDNFITMSQERGFDTSELIFVNHDKSSHGD